MFKLLHNETSIQDRKKVRTGHGTTDWFKIGKGVHQGTFPNFVILFIQLICRVHHAKFLARWLINWNQDARRNINNLRYADDTTIMAESKEELKKHLIEGERGEWKCWLKTQHSRNEDHGIWSYHFMAKKWGKCENSVRFYFPGLQNQCGWWL